MIGGDIGINEEEGMEVATNIPKVKGRNVVQKYHGVDHPPATFNILILKILMY
jgi:hypothetical protein